MFLKRLVSAIFSTALVCTAYAEPAQKPPLPPQLQLPTSPWYFDTGLRYWLGDATFKFNLYDTYGDDLLSRLTNQNVMTNTAEAFFRLTHQNGVFFKGYVGGGSNLNGQFFDEDFPPVIDVYSKTESIQKDGRLNYFSLDLGYDLLQKDWYKLSPFIGYHYWFTRYNNFGCKQIASNPDVCARFNYPNTTDTLNDAARWYSLRLGLNGVLQFTDNFQFVLDAAYIYAYLLGNDYHNLRPDIRGDFFEGTGHGFQLDGIFNWALSPNLSMGLGGRVWDVHNKGYDHLQETAVQGYPQYIDVTQTNYGITFQSQYRFDDGKKRFLFMDKDGFSSGPKHFKGAYLGGNLGYGTSYNNALVYPLSTASESMALLAPVLVHLQTSGFLAGGQIGYNWTKQNLLWGIESDIDYASIGGTNSVTRTPFPYQATSSVTQHLNWFGTVRGRLGKVVSTTFLPYVTAGLSFANLDLLHEQTILYSPTSHPLLQARDEQTETQLHWAAGAGLEYAVSDHLNYKLEYLYLDIGRYAFNTKHYQVQSDLESNLIRLGVNYHF